MPNNADSGAGNAAGSIDADVQDAREDADAAPPETDGGPVSDAVCFGAPPPMECGVLAQWPALGAKDSTGRWTLLRALPIDGGDGFAAILVEGDPASGNHYLARLDARTGCAGLVSRAWNAGRSLRAVYRAIIRGGTFAVLAQCIQRFGCGKTLFVNGVAWPDAAATPDQSIFDIDVATDGRVLVVSKDYGDGGETLVIRRLSPSRQILLERRFPTSPGAFIWKAAVLPDGSSALVFETPGPYYYLSFQSPDFENWLAMIPAPGNRGQTLGRNGTWLGWGGAADSAGLWFGVVHGQQRLESWSHNRPELPRDNPSSGVVPMGIEANADGSLNAVVLTTAGTYLVLGESQDRLAPPTPMLLDRPDPVPLWGRSVVPALSTQSDGSVLWSGELWGKYCQLNPLK